MSRERVFFSGFFFSSSLGQKLSLSHSSLFFFHFSLKTQLHRAAAKGSSSAIAGFSLGLEVDPHLERLVLTLASAKRKGRLAEATAAVASSPSSPYLLPPRDLEKHPLHSHPLTVCLDVDGTLIASYPPSRAGALLAPRGDGGGGKGSKPPAAFLVGQGSRLNPSGVLVLERPGLGEFLEKLSEFAEVVLFTGEGEEEFRSERERESFRERERERKKTRRRREKNSLFNLLALCSPTNKKSNFIFITHNSRPRGLRQPHRRGPRGPPRRRRRPAPVAPPLPLLDDAGAGLPLRQGPVEAGARPEDDRAGGGHGAGRAGAAGQRGSGDAVARWRGRRR